jgi:prophage tail gpP-like protein
MAADNIRTEAIGGRQQQSDFELFVNGNEFRHFTRGFVKLSLEQVASSFEFSYADLRIDLGEDWPINAGDACQIYLRNKLLLTGYIDDISVQYDANKLALTAKGRSKLGDLVDSSAHYKNGRFGGRTLLEISTRLVAPFGTKASDRIQVEIDEVGDYAKTFKRFAINPGESVVETITRAAQARGFHPISTPEGNLRLIAAGEDVIQNFRVEYGVNVIRGERLDSVVGRHSAYFLKGQSPSDADENRRTTAQEQAAIFDAQIERYRPLLLVSTGQKGRAALRRRAIWERNRRQGQGERLIYRVDGFGPTNEDLWFPGPSVRILDDRLQVHESRLLSAAAYTFSAEGDEGGRVTDLTFVDKAAFALVSQTLTPKEQARADKQHKDWTTE